MLRFAVGLSSLLLGFSALVTAQQIDPAGGVPLFSTQVSGLIDTVDPASSNILITIPVRSKIGKTPFNFALITNNHVFLNGNQWSVAGYLQGETLSLLDARVSYTTTTQEYCPNSNSNVTEYSGYYVVDSSGGYHPLPFAYIPYGLCSFTVSGTTTDGSGYTVILPAQGQGSRTIYDASGNVQTISGTTVTVTDPDGVTMQRATSGAITTYTDTLATAAVTATLHGGPSSDTYAFPNSNGQPYTVGYTQYTEQTNFGCTGISEWNLGSVYLPTSVTTPTGDVYNISYEPTPQGGSSQVTGRISKVTLPTGGYISYTYTGGKHGIDCNSGVVPTLTRKVYDGSSGWTSTWKYVNSNDNSTPGTFTVTLTDAANNETLYTFAGGFQTQAQYYQGTTTILKTVSTCYNGNTSNCATASVPTTPITETDVYTSFNTSSPNRVQTLYDSYGNVTQVSNYDFGAATPTNKIFVPRGSWNGSGCSQPVASYAYDRLCYKNVEDGSNALQSSETYTYDGNGHLSTHVVAIDKAGVGGPTLTAAYTWNSNGSLKTVTDSNGLVTTLHYDGSCHSLLPTSTTNSFNSLTSSQAYDSGCAGAVVVSKTSVDGNPWTYQYNDPLWRQTSVTDPTGYEVDTAYTTNSVRTYSSFNSGTLQHVVTLDGLGRPIFDQTYQGAVTGKYDTVRTTYDLMSRVSNVSAPFTAALGTGTCTSPCTQSAIAYDGLGRVSTATDANGGVTTHTYSGADDLAVLTPVPSGDANPKSRQTEFDGLGRLASVCEVTTTANGGTSCGQARSATGYPTSYAYSATGRLIQVTQGAQTRTFNYDAVGRLTSEVNPENGTKTYTYDSSSSCSSPYNNAGDLIKILNNSGKYTCIQYDLLHRMIARTHSGDSVTDSQHFTWDSATYNSTGLGQGGRIAEAWTCKPGQNSCALGDPNSKVFELFQYDTRGNLTKYNQQSPDSNGLYGITENYDSIGNMQSIVGVASVPELTIGTYDGEGRPTQINASSGPSPVASNVS